MKTKKILSAFLSAALVFSVLPITLGASGNYVPESVDFEVACDFESVNAGTEFDVKIYAVNTAALPQKIEAFDFVIDYSDGTAENSAVKYKSISLADAFADEIYVIDNGAVSYIEDLGNGDDAVAVPAGGRVLVATASFASAADLAESVEVSVGVDDAYICLVGDTSYNGYAPKCTAAEIKVESSVPGVVYGDADGDGDVTLADIAIFGKILAKWIGFELPEDTTVLDLNADGKVNPLDLVYMARHVANWDGYKVLPVGK